MFQLICVSTISKILVVFFYLQVMKLQSQVRGASDPENLLSSPTQKERKEYRVFFQNQTTPKVIYSVRERERTGSQ